MHGISVGRGDSPNKAKGIFLLQAKLTAEQLR